MFCFVVGFLLLLLMGAILDYYGKRTATYSNERDRDAHRVSVPKSKTSSDTDAKQLNILIQEIRDSPEYIAVLRDINSFFDDLKFLKKSYITYRDTENIHIKYDSTYHYVSRLPTILRDEEPCISLLREYPNIDDDISIWNKEFIDSELVATQDLFDNVDGKILDRDQRVAVITDEDNELIIAGAGSGKTLTLSAKVQYLIQRKSVLPEQILLISFTNKATNELRDRVFSGIGKIVTAKTFHKLGLDIITGENLQAPNVTSPAYLEQFVKEYFSTTLLTDPIEVNRILTFFGSYIDVPKDLEQYASAEDAVEFYRKCPINTLRSFIESFKSNAEESEKQTHAGERVKSIEELIIADYLYINGIEYEYECQYPFPSEDVTRKPYRPDFYLPEYNIYLEHFGISEDGTVSWLPKDEALKYISEMEWKRDFHKLHGTKLIETYSYYHTQGILLEKLHELLVQNKVKFHPRDLKEIYLTWLKRKYNSGYDDFIKLIATFITHYKSKGYNGAPSGTLRGVLAKMKHIYYVERMRLFLEVVTPIYEKYQQSLQDSDTIDFSDMINIATDIVESGQVNLPYTYIIIDEFQDISFNKYRLIKALREKSGAKIVCVGDDWQSIYQFAGSDIDFFVNFEKYFGKSAILQIEQTYRNSQELIDEAGKFIMKNPYQIKKRLLSMVNHTEPIQMVCYDYGISEALQKIVDVIVDDFGEDTKVLVLGRNRLRDGAVCVFGNGYHIRRVGEKAVYFQSKKYPNLTLEYMTIHSAKGLEADNVIILDLEDKLHGIPSKMPTNMLLSPVLVNDDSYPYAEERRLFYVALTRTKNTVYLPVPRDVSRRSAFIRELGFKEASKFGNYVDGVEHSTKHENPLCPKCGAKMTLRNGPHGPFYGCPNYPDCKETVSCMPRR